MYIRLDIALLACTQLRYALVVSLLVLLNFSVTILATMITNSFVPFVYGITPLSLP